jgi:RNA polymerase sigma-70 factor (ECF subfamily)
VPIRSWFFRIAANLIADLYRAPATVQPLQVWQHGQTLAASGRTDAEGYGGSDGAIFDPPDPRAEAEIAAWEGAEDFLRLVADLTPEQRLVLQLRFAESLSIAEIARQMGRSEGAIKMLMMRGLQQLRRRWGREAVDDR